MGHCMRWPKGLSEFVDSTENCWISLIRSSHGRAYKTLKALPRLKNSVLMNGAMEEVCFNTSSTARLALRGRMQPW